MKKYIAMGVVAAVIFGGYFAVNAIFSTDYTIPTTRAKKGPFAISLTCNGRIDAKRAMTLSAPRIRNLQITWLAPEGSTVAEGDPVIRFDASQQSTSLADHESDLKINSSSLERARQEYTIQEKQLTLNLEKSRRNYDEKKHEAKRVATEARLELELAELNFEAKLNQLKGDVERAEVEVDRARDKVKQARKELAEMTIRAPIPGLVVYLEIWKGGSRSKVQEGDGPWPGMGLVNLPDLSEMIVKATVSEVDANKVDSGQEVVVVLDAFPDKEYSGIVHNKSVLARRKDPGSKIHVFDVDVSILDPDEGLKPGMSASCDIIIDRVGEVVSVPLEAVFESGGSTIVYLKNKKERKITVGRRNDMAVVVLTGLEGGEEICLINPNFEEGGLPGDRATQPEMNKGRQPSKKSSKRSGRGMKKGGR